jgi:hypothetical protein
MIIIWRSRGRLRSCNKKLTRKRNVMKRFRGLDRRKRKMNGKGEK